MILGNPVMITLSEKKMRFGKRKSSFYMSRGSRINKTVYIRSEQTYTQYGRRRCECLNLYKELIPYAEAWSWQKSIVEKRQSLMINGEDHSDTLIVLQHPPVYTLGTGSSEEYLNFDVKHAPYDMYRVERGGEVTYHGPGQIVLYPIINLRYHKTDLHWYLRSLEEVIIRVLSNAFSIKASRVNGLTGVWIGNKKIAAIGIKVSRWITYHGLALNVVTDLAPFQHIVPCGIRDRQVGNLTNHLGVSSSGRTAEYMSQLMDITHDSLLREFSEVFQLSIEFTSKFEMLRERPSNS